MSVIRPLAVMAATWALAGSLAAQTAAPRVIECRTTSTKRVQCAGGGTISTVSLLRDLSFNRCRSQGSWGWTKEAVWVDNSCRGQFEVRSAGGVGEAKRIICGTIVNTRVECKTEGYATSVRLIREISSNRCQRGTTWGNSDSLIWASGGCRGDFLVTYGSRQPGFTTTPTATNRIINCGTQYDPQVTCSTEGRATSVRLMRDLSGNRCREGSNWGHTDSLIWANRGCRAEFEVTYRGSPTARPVPLPAPVPAQNTRIITCGNSSGSAMSCNAFETVANMRLQRDRSGGRCNQSSAWGSRTAPSG